jgi:hypothetical protein
MKRKGRDMQKVRDMSVILKRHDKNAAAKSAAEKIIRSIFLLIPKNIDVGSVVDRSYRTIAFKMK